ncbi:4-hydroxybenzoate decarboxylase [bacterium K02(2017)]|nr:4-hydroxybenzoate decarboxylase [bacterium K02(2017)]
MTKPSLITSTQQFVQRLRSENEVLDIHEEIDPDLELAEIQRRVVQQKGKAILFHRVKGTEFKVATNLFGSQKRIDIAFSKRPVNLIKQAVNTLETLFPPNLNKIWQAKNLAWDLLKVGSKKVANGPLLQNQINDLSKLPQIKCWPEDGGAFVTLPLVYTQSPSSQKPNLGMYRIQLFNKNQCGMHIQIHRGGGFHYHEAENKGQSLPAHIYIGGPPACIIAAVAPFPEDISEILLASLLTGSKLKQIQNPQYSELPLLADADFCIVGKIPPFKRKAEGPFGDHYGYYSLQHDYPYLEVDKIFHRNDAIYPATVVGRPPQEDHFIACYLQELLTPLIKMVMPQVKSVWAYEESGVHSLAAALVKDRYPREALTTALRILGEGQLSLSKILMVTDKDCEIKDFKSLFQIILERIDFKKDLFILSNISQDTLDYTGPKVNEGSKAIFLGLGEVKNKLNKVFNTNFNDQRFSSTKVFCPGALVVQGPSYSHQDDLAQILANNPAIDGWSMVFLVDDAEASVLSSQDFIWHIFTRFEPAADIYARSHKLIRYHVSLEPPVVIDCRMKPWYPKELKSEPSVINKLKPILDKYGLT